MKNTKAAFLAVLLFVFVMAQFVMPKLGLSLLINPDASCYSGNFSLVERVNTDGGSSCGGNISNAIGFPFVINSDYIRSNLVGFAINTSILGFVIFVTIKAINPKKRSS